MCIIKLPTPEMTVVSKYSWYIIIQYSAHITIIFFGMANRFFKKNFWLKFLAKENSSILLSSVGSYSCICTYVTL